MALAGPEALAGGVYTASAGNMAQGVAWNARRLGIPCAVVVPDHAPRAKLDAVERLGARVVSVPVDRWWQVLAEHRYPGLDGLFIHPVADRAVIAGNGTIGLEIFEDLSGVEAIVVPWGGGGLSCGIAAAARGLSPSTKVFAAEVETAAPLSAARAAGRPVPVAYTPSFVDGIGARGLLAPMWPLAQELISDSLVVSLAETAAAIRVLASRARVVAEGAGAVPVAAALSGRAGAGRIVCIVSGGNIDAERLAEILRG
jgi:threonine dehydratase